MGIFKKSPEKIFKKSQAKELLASKVRNMTDMQLIMAMILIVDSYDAQFLTDDDPIGAEAVKRSGFNVFEDSYYQGDYK